MKRLRKIILFFVFVSLIACEKNELEPETNSEVVNLDSLPLVGRWDLVSRNHVPCDEVPGDPLNGDWTFNLLGDDQGRYYTFLADGTFTLNDRYHGKWGFEDGDYWMFIDNTSCCTGGSRYWGGLRMASNNRSFVRLSTTDCWTSSTWVEPRRSAWLHEKVEQ